MMPNQPKTQSKDPAFLFYSRDFYESTRMMLPAERACYIDLLIYQHQNGPIPDTDRMLLYCSGVDAETLRATLQAKFTLTPDGWINERLDSIMQCREEYSEKQSIKGRVGQFFKAAKKFLSGKEYGQLKAFFSGMSPEEILEKIEGQKLDEAGLKQLLKHMLKPSLSTRVENENAIANAIEIENENKGERGGVGESEGSRRRNAPSPDVEEVVGELNALAGRAFDPTSALTVKLVTARLAEYPLEDLIDVVRLKVRQWKADAKMSQYLQPSTLFAATNCAKYVEEMRQYRDHGVKLRVNGKRDPREQAREVMADFVNGTYQSIYK